MNYNHQEDHHQEHIDLSDVYRDDKDELSSSHHNQIGIAGLTR